jgi:hypothetical protein
MAETAEKTQVNVMQTPLGTFPLARYKTFFNTSKPVVFGFDPSKTDRPDTALHIAQSVKRPVWNIGYARDEQDSVKLVADAGREARFLLKGPSEAVPLVPELEKLVLELAVLAGLEAAEAWLVETPAKQVSLLVKRADAPVKNKPSAPVKAVLPEASAATTWEQLATAVKKGSSHSGFDLLGVLERALFSYLIGAYNVSPRKFFFVEDAAGLKKMGPISGYLPMLTMFSKQIDPQDFAFPLNSKTRKLNVQDFLHFGSTVGLYGKQIDNAVRRFADVLPVWEQHIKACPLPTSYRNDLLDLIEQRAGRLMMRRRF